jgi:hypothetical protein
MPEFAALGPRFRGDERQQRNYTTIVRRFAARVMPV